MKEPTNQPSKQPKPETQSIYRIIYFTFVLKSTKTVWEMNKFAHLTRVGEMSQNLKGLTPFSHQLRNTIHLNLINPFAQLMLDCSLNEVQILNYYNYALYEHINSGAFVSGC